MKNISWLAPILTLLLIDSPVAVGATTASLVVNRNTCEAPCAIHAQSIATTDTSVTDSFRELRYVYDFDDPGSGTWTHSGESKNAYVGGPIAAHVYDSAGSYTITVSVGDDTAQQIITVSNPDTVYTGTNTICLSLTTDMVDCPAGASQLTSISSWPTWASDRRYLLHVGQDFTALSGISFGQLQNTQIASFGTGTKPKVNKITPQTDSASYPDVLDGWITNVSIFDLDAKSINHNLIGFNLLFYRNNLWGVDLLDGIYLTTGYLQRRQGQDYPISLRMPKYLFVIENTSTAGYATHNGEGITVWMGNHFQNTREHNLRLFQFYMVHSSHNLFAGTSDLTGKANMKIHGRGFDALAPDSAEAAAYMPQSRYAVIGYNTANDAGSVNIWATFTAKPQDKILGEGLEDIIYENNTNIEGTQVTAAGAYAAHNVTTRSEIMVGTLTGPSLNHEGEDLPVYWQGPYYIDVAMPPAPSAVTVISFPGSPVNNQLSTPAANGKEYKFTTNIGWGYP